MRAIRIPMTSLAFVVACLANGLHAETGARSSTDNFYNLSLAELGQIEISIATGNSTPLDRAPATATVISAGEIHAMGARTLNDVLETVPGLHVSLSSLSRLDSVYSIRGIHTGFNPQVLLLMNGVPVQSSLQGSRPSLFRFPVASIERIEVIRGPGSAIYGADAYAGVINVITKDASTSTNSEVGLRAGAFDSKDIWLQTATQTQDWGIAFNLAYQESNGDGDRQVNADLQSTLDSFLGTNASLAPGSLSTRYQILDSHLALNSEQMKINLWSWISEDAGIGAGGAQALDLVGEDDSKLWMVDATYHLNEGPSEWDNSVRLSYLYYDLQSQFNLLPPGTLLPIGGDGNLNFTAPAGMVLFPDGLIGNPGQESSDAQAEFVSIYSGWESHRLRLAVGARKQTLDAREYKNFGPGVINGTEGVVSGELTDVSDTTYVFLEDGSRNIRYLSVQDEWQIVSDLELTAGVRYDDYSDFGGTTNPRIALVWANSENLTSKLLYGSAFRAPSFTEQHAKNNPVALGNPNLDPEQIDTLELSFNYLFNQDLQSTLTLFTYQARDMIEFMPDEMATTKTAQNIRDQNGDGFEWELNWKPAAQLHLSGSYSQQDARDEYNDAPVPDAPGEQFKMDLNWEFRSNWLLHGQLNWVGDRQRAVLDPRADIDDYTLLNLTLRRKNILPALDLSLTLRNLADENAYEPSSGEIAEDYPLESRSAWLEVTYRFN
jgi:outer membrane receptor for ferrienterochelin and colicins